MNRGAGNRVFPDVRIRLTRMSMGGAYRLGETHSAHVAEFTDSQCRDFYRRRNTESNFNKISHRRLETVFIID